MGWHPPVPVAVEDADQTRWLVSRSWPAWTAGDYVLEVRAEGRPGVRAAHLRAGQFELPPPGRDRRLPALRQAARRGEVVAHRATRRAVVRAGDRYLKIFRPNQSDEAAARHTRMNALLGAEDFLTPALVFCGPGCLTLTRLPGRSLFDLGQDLRISDTAFEHAWHQWSVAWLRQQSRVRAAANRATIEALPARPAAAELENLRRIVNVWLLHAGDVPAARAQRLAVRAAAGDAARELLEGVPDPLVWSHGDLHDKQIFVQDPDSPLGLLDFDEAGRAEAAADLANLAVHLELRLGQGRLTPERYRAAYGQVLATVEALEVTPARFDAYAIATRLRLGCLYSFRPQWAVLAEEFLLPNDEQALAATVPAAKVVPTY